MKSILFSVFLYFLFYCSPNNIEQTSQNSNFVFDTENILTVKQEDQFNKLFSEHEIKTSNEIAIHTTSNYGKYNNILDYSVDYFNHKGIGKKDKDNGVLIVFSQANREVRITTGYGTEKVLTDHIAKKIIDSLIVPEFKKGNNFEGLWKASKYIVKFLSDPKNKIKSK